VKAHVDEALEVLEARKYPGLRGMSGEEIPQWWRTVGSRKVDEFRMGRNWEEEVGRVKKRQAEERSQELRKEERLLLERLAKEDELGQQEEEELKKQQAEGDLRLGDLIDRMNRQVEEMERKQKEQAERKTKSARRSVNRGREQESRLQEKKAEKTGEKGLWRVTQKKLGRPDKGWFTGIN
jgi:hypothetical protein